MEKIFWFFTIDRITSFFGKDIKLGGYVARLTPLIIALAVYNKVRFFNIIVLLISLLITGISGERTAFGMIVLFTIGFVIFSKTDFKNKILLLLSPFLIFTILVFSSQTIKYRVLTSTLNQLNFNQQKPFFMKLK